jgi:hypothetical protein
MDTAFGLPVNDPLLSNLDFNEELWWKLFAAAALEPTNERTKLHARLARLLDPKGTEHPLDLMLDWARSGGPKRTFIIDGLDLRFPAVQLKDPMRSLEAMVARLVDSLGEDQPLPFRLIVFFRRYIPFKEPAPDGLVLIRWDFLEILHYLLFRLAVVPEIKRLLPDAGILLSKRMDKIKEMQLEEEECLELLRLFFPMELQPHLALPTFLRTWFVDDIQNRMGYLPAVFNAFVDGLHTNGVSVGAGSDGPRFMPAAILEAHRRAATRHVELHLSTVANLAAKDPLKYQDFVNSLHGESVPFAAAEWAPRHDLPLIAATGLLDDLVGLGLFFKVGDEYDAGRLTRTALGLRQRQRTPPSSPRDDKADRRKRALGFLGAFGAVLLGAAALSGSDSASTQAEEE